MIVTLSKTTPIEITTKQLVNGISNPELFWIARLINVQPGIGRNLMK